MLFISTSTVVHTEWQPVAVHTEGPCGPNSDPPRPCPSGWAAAPSRCRLLNPGGCHSCCPAMSWASGRGSPASRGRLWSWPGWASAGGQTPAFWASPGGWWGRKHQGRGSEAPGLYVDAGLGRWWRGQGGGGCSGYPVSLERKHDREKRKMVRI